LTHIKKKYSCLKKVDYQNDQKNTVENFQNRICCLSGLSTHIKGKETIHVTGCGEPYRFETLRLPRFLHILLTDGSEVGLIFFAALYHQEDSRAIVWPEGLSQLKNPVTHHQESNP
jgi:hypothetical protein